MNRAAASRLVASEVRSLAQRSAEAAKEIKNLINASVERVDHGTALVDEAGATMTEVVASIRRVTDIMGEIDAASSEQNASVAQIGNAVTQMDQATQQNAALVEESAAAAESLKVQARQLVQTVAVFTLDGGSAGAGSYATTPLVPLASLVKHAAPASKAVSASATPAVVKAAPVSTSVGERRSPQRAKNVVRPSFGNGPSATPSSPAPAAPASPDSHTGTDDWTTF